MYWFHYFSYKLTLAYCVNKTTKNFALVFQNILIEVITVELSIRKHQNICFWIVGHLTAHSAHPTNERKKKPKPNNCCACSRTQSWRQHHRWRISKVNTENKPDDDDGGGCAREKQINPKLEQVHNSPHRMVKNGHSRRVGGFDWGFEAAVEIWNDDAQRINSIQPHCYLDDNPLTGRRRVRGKWVGYETLMWEKRCLIKDQ